LLGVTVGTTEGCDGFYTDEHGNIEILAFRSTKLAGLEADWSYNVTTKYNYRSVFLVSNGGASKTSLEFPDINTPL
jgi:hypothetical protein